MKKLILLTVLSLFSSASNEMRALYLKNSCHSCHGMYGEGMGASPRLQGVSEDILLRRLKDLQAGKPRTAFGTVMISFAKALDENQTKAMAKYLSNIKMNISEERYEIEFSTAGDGGS